MLSASVLYHPNVSTAGIEEPQYRSTQHGHQHRLSVDCLTNDAPESFNCCTEEVRLMATRPHEAVSAKPAWLATSIALLQLAAPKLQATACYHCHNCKLLHATSASYCMLLHATTA